MSSQFYELNQHILQEVQDNPYLGLQISNDLKWNIHVNKVYNKANNILGFIRRNLRNVPEECRKTANILHFEIVVLITVPTFTGIFVCWVPTECQSILIGNWLPAYSIWSDADFGNQATNMWNFLVVYNKNNAY